MRSVAFCVVLISFFTNPIKSMKQDDICSICLDPFDSLNKAFEQICENHHRICGDCCDQLLTTLHHIKQCPECRMPLEFSNMRLQLSLYHKVLKQISISKSEFNNSEQYITRPIRVPVISTEPAEGAQEAHPVEIPVNTYQQILVVCLVWGPTLANIYYLLFLLSFQRHGIFSVLLLYIFFTQLAVIARSRNQIYAVASRQEKLQVLLKHVLFFTVDANQPLTCLDYMMFSKELLLIAVICTLQVIFRYSFHEVGSIIVLALNIFSLGAYYAVHNRLTRPILRSFTSYLQTHKTFTSFLVYFLVLLCYVNYVLLCSIFYLFFTFKAKILVVAISLICNLVAAIQRCPSGQKKLQSVKIVLGLPFFVANLMNTGIKCKYLPWLLFFIKYFGSLLSLEFILASTVDKNQQNTHIMGKKLQYTPSIMTIFQNLIEGDRHDII